MDSKIRVAFDAERMKYPNTGLYEYCFHLGRALIKNTDPEQAAIHFYIPKSAKEKMGNNMSYVTQHSFHKFRMPSLKEFNIWHSTYQSTNYYPSKRKINIILTLHDLNFMHDVTKSSDKKKHYLARVEKHINRADYVTAISKFTLSDVQQYIDLRGKPSTVIYNGCNIKEITHLQTPDIVPPVPFLFTIGTITGKKNFHVLPALLRQNEMQLIIAGITQSDSYKEKIIEEAKKMGVLNRIVFTGAISENDKQWYYKNCMAFVFPSLTEGFGFPVVEAMYFGKPVFLSTKTSLPEIGGDVAYYFDSFDPDAMQYIFQKGMEHYKSTNPIEQIRKRAGLYNWDDAAKNYIDIYHQLS